MHSMKAQFEALKLSPIDLAYFEHEKGRKFAPLPNCKLRALARRSGFHSSKEFLDAERAAHARVSR